MFLSPWFAILWLLLAEWIVFQIYGLALLAVAWHRWRKTPVRGILVYSDSPNWKEYIENRWLAAIEDHVVILNWSERRIWHNSLPVRIHRYYVLRRWGECECKQTDINPAVILFRGLRYPHVYRYYQAFRDNKHGRPEGLRELEDKMFAEIGGS